MKLFIIIIVAIISNIDELEFNSVQKNNIYPDENFYTIDFLNDSIPCIGTFNMAYKDYTQKEKYPWCLTINIALELENLFDNGLPKDIESNIVYKLEDELLLNINKIATAHYIGHLFNDEFLDIFIYLDEPEKVHDFLQTQINKEGLIRSFGYEITEDSTWENVIHFLNINNDNK